MEKNGKESSQPISDSQIEIEEIFLDESERENEEEGKKIRKSKRSHDERISPFSRHQKFGLDEEKLTSCCYYSALKLIKKTEVEFIKLYGQIELLDGTAWYVIGIKRSRRSSNYLIVVVQLQDNNNVKKLEVPVHEIYTIQSPPESVPVELSKLREMWWNEEKEIEEKKRLKKNSKEKERRKSKRKLDDSEDMDSRNFKRRRSQLDLVEQSEYIERYEKTLQESMKLLEETKIWIATLPTVLLKIQEETQAKAFEFFLKAMEISKK